jgi:ribose transport system substrate-binding protein
MTRNNILLVVTLCSLAVTLATIKTFQNRSHSSGLNASPGSHLSDAEASIVLYEPLPHPYCTEVGEGATAYGKEHNIPILVKVGQESTQANVNQNIESLFTMGYRAFSFYPVDPAGSKGLMNRLHHSGKIAVVYGAQPEEGSETSFAVATDTRKAAALATEKLVQLMGGHGRILNVLESMTDGNTPLRIKAIEGVVSNHAEVHIIQTVGDVTTEQQAREKIESALVARGDEVDGIICTGYTTTVATAMLISEHNSKPGARFIHFVGLDTDERVIKAIREGWVDATLAQNPFGHGYISVALLDLMQKGWIPKSSYQFIDSGCMVITKENVAFFHTGIQEMTRVIVDDLRTKYLTEPALK